MKDAHTQVTAYALHRPDGQWSLMLINEDHDQARQVRIVFQGADRTDTSFAGSVAMVTFGKEQYQWHSARKQGHAIPMARQ